MAEAPRVAVVIPSRDAALVIGAQLEALITQDVAEPVEIVVVDNGSMIVSPGRPVTCTGGAISARRVMSARGAT